MMNNTTRKGDCECCPKVDITLHAGSHGIWMCDSCFEKENNAVATIKASNAIIADARKTDAQVEVKSELFNAGTVAFVALKAAIDNNPEVADADKGYALAGVTSERIQKLQAVIFENEAALQALKNEKQALLVNMQNLVATLRIDQKEKFKQYNVNYSPNIKSTPKPKVVKKTKGFSNNDMIALREAAKKYDVAPELIRSLILSRKDMSVEQAAKQLSEMLK